MLTPEDVIWEPYSPEAVATRAPAGLSSHCSANASLWFTSAVLVYDIAVEAYCPGESGDSLGSARSFRCPPRWSVSVARTTDNYELTWLIHSCRV